MRLFAAFIPAGMITLVLFALMQYLITGGHPPVAPPAHSGFVDLIRLRAAADDSDNRVSKRATPRQQRQSARIPQLPQAPDSENRPPPQLARLDIGLPEPPAPKLASAPTLAALEPPPLIESGPVQPPPPANTTGQMAASRMPVTSPAGATNLPATTQTDLAGALDGVSEGDGNPIPLLRIEPAYPRKAARNRKEGWVKLAFTITERGTVIDPVVIESRPRRLFNRSAVAAIRKWRFKPKVVDGAPVSTRATQVIEFKLAGR